MLSFPKPSKSHFELQTLWDAAASLRTHIGTGSICALWFHRPGGYRREWSPKNVSRHKNSPYGTEGLAVGISASHELLQDIVDYLVQHKMEVRTVGQQ